MAKILIIEDDPYVRNMYRRVFIFEKMDVDIAENGTEGLKKAGKSSYDLIILDILMSDISGVEVLRQLKSQEQTKNIPVVMVTAVEDDKIIEETTRLGAVSYLLKSNYTPQQVLKTVKGIIK